MARQRPTARRAVTSTGPRVADKPASGRKQKSTAGAAPKTQGARLKPDRKPQIKGLAASATDLLLEVASDVAAGITQGITKTKEVAVVQAKKVGAQVAKATKRVAPAKAKKAEAQPSGALTEGAPADTQTTAQVAQPKARSKRAPRAAAQKKRKV